MICRNFSVRWWLFLLLLISQLNCFSLAQTRKVKFDETFILRADETAETEDAELKIRLSGVGREISEGGEVEYVELTVRLNKSERQLTLNERKNRSSVVGNFIIELINAESFGERNCRLKISRRNSKNH